MPFLLAALVGVGLEMRSATLDVTPPELLPLGGYSARQGKIAERGGQKLYARALKLGSWTLVSVDMLTIPEKFYQEVKKRSGCENLWLVATHTHCAPDSQMLNPQMTMVVPGIASYSPRWFDWYAEKVSEVVEKVNRAPAVPVMNLSIVRARVRLNHGRRQGAKPDQTAWVLKADGKPILASYAAHATFHEESWNKLDGDWPGALAHRLDVPVLPGAIGDVAPESAGSGPVEKCHNFVENFWRTVAKSRVSSVWPDRQFVGQSQGRFSLSAPVPHPSFAKNYGVPEPLAQVLVNRFAQTDCLVQIASFGKFLIVGIPGEPTAELGRQIQTEARLQGFPHCLVVSHVNGWIGYVLEPKDYDRGGYESTLSFNGRDTASKLRAAVAELLRSHRGQ